MNGKDITAFDYLELKKLFEKPGTTVTIPITRDAGNTEFKLKLERLI